MTIKLTRWYPASLTAIAMMISLLSSSVYATEILEWKRKPLVITLPINQEKIIELNRNVRVGLTPDLANPKVLRLESTGGALYLKAYKAFPTERIRIQDLATGDMILVDLSASKNGSSETVKVVSPDSLPETLLAKSASGNASKVTASSDRKEANQLSGRPPLPIVLTRYAAQSLYSPLRAIEAIPGMRRIPMKISRQLPVMPSLPVVVKPLAAWIMGDLSVTALEVRNLDDLRAFDLDPRWLQIDVLTASFMHRKLGKAGSIEDSTTLFVVTQGTLASNVKKWGW